MLLDDELLPEGLVDGEVELLELLPLGEVELLPVPDEPLMEELPLVDGLVLLLEEPGVVLLLEDELGVVLLLDELGVVLLLVSVDDDDEDVAGGVAGGVTVVLLLLLAGGVAGVTVTFSSLLQALAPIARARAHTLDNNILEFIAKTPFKLTGTKTDKPMRPGAGALRPAAPVARKFGAMRRGLDAAAEPARGPRLRAVTEGAGRGRHPFARKIFPLACKHCAARRPRA